MSRKTRKLRSKNELGEASKKLAYEIAMLTETLRESEKVDDYPVGDFQKRVIQNAFIHTFLFLVRNLRAFFYAKRPDHRDIIASDFFDDPSTWLGNRPFEAPELQEFRDPINHRLGHLSWERLESEPPDWPMGQLAYCLVAPLRMFGNLVDQHKVVPQLSDLITNLDEVASANSSNDSRSDY